MITTVPGMRAMERLYRAANWSAQIARSRAADGRTAMLPDGAPIVIRPVRPDDASLLTDGFARLSEQSRRSRFLMGKNELTAAELRYLTEVDHHDHEALAALSDGRGIGIARYVRDDRNPCRAELAVTVVDEWHGRGVGSLLLSELATRALREGISRFTALVSADNGAARGVLQKLGRAVQVVAAEFDTLEYEIALMSLA